MRNVNSPKQGASYVLMGLLKANLFTFHLSIPLVLEYEDTCKRLLDEKIALTLTDIDDYIDYLCSLGKKHEVYYLWRPFLSDPRDDMVLELAVKANCDWIVTYNLSDFRGSEQFGVQAVNPVPFLKHLGELP